MVLITDNGEATCSQPRHVPVHFGPRYSNKNAVNVIPLMLMFEEGGTINLCIFLSGNLM